MATRPKGPADPRPPAEKPARGLLGDVESRLGEAWHQLRGELSARREVDVSGMVAGLRARLEGRLRMTPLPVEADLADRRGPLGLGRVRTWAFESEELRKGVLAQIDLRPVVEGLAITLAPRRTQVAPVFAADLMVLPSRLSVNADVYGAPARTRGLLAPLAPTFARLGAQGIARSGPEWTAAIASGEGLHARGSARIVDDLFAALTAAFARYLEVLTEPASPSATAPNATASAEPGRPPAVDPGALATEQSAFFAAFHAHGPRVGPLGQIFGAPWAERFSRLLFE